MLHNTHRIMEINDVLLILAVFLPVFFVGIWQLNRLNPPKKGVKAGDSSIKEMYGVYNQQVTDVLKVKDRQISSLSTKLRNYEESNEEEEEPTEKGATFEEITQLVKVSYPQYAKMLPLFKDQILKATKGMTINEIIQYIGSITGKTPTGGLSQAATTQDAQSYRTDWA